MKITCRTCKEHTDNFYKSEGLCIPCHKAKSAKWYQENKVKKQTSSRKNYYKKTYNLTLKQRDEFFKDFSHTCTICECKVKKKGKLAGNQGVIDHCHDTGEIRGLLCAQCNKALGCFKDNIESLKNAIKYLGQNSCKKLKPKDRQKYSHLVTNT